MPLPKVDPTLFDGLVARGDTPMDTGALMNRIIAENPAIALSLKALLNQKQMHEFSGFLQCYYILQSQADCDDLRETAEAEDSDAATVLELEALVHRLQTERDDYYNKLLAAQGEIETLRQKVAKDGDW